MPRYIDADKFIEWIDAGHLRSATEVCLSENNVLKMIDLQPTADVAEVKHGEWESKGTHGDFEEKRCSICNGLLLVKWYDRTMNYNYCPNCGAKMDGETE